MRYLKDTLNWSREARKESSVMFNKNITIINEQKSNKDNYINADNKGISD